MKYYLLLFTSAASFIAMCWLARCWFKIEGIEDIFLTKADKGYGVEFFSRDMQLTHTEYQFRDTQAEINYRRWQERVVQDKRGWHFEHSTNRGLAFSPDKKFFGVGAGVYRYDLRRSLNGVDGRIFVASFIRFPYWILMPLTTILPALFLKEIFRLRRIAVRVNGNLCLACNYDLRASKDRCPECGTLILPANNSAAQ